jgi:uncharacterized glyoxalase superfamily protein PhnB
MSLGAGVARTSGMTLVPYFSYRDAAAALDWLEQAFGFERSQDYRDDAGIVIHAEMTFGGGALMLGTGDPPAAASAPTETSPTGHGVYVVVDDVDAHHRQAQALGAVVVYPPEETEFGTRRYRALDLEGYEWSFGTYRPST